MRLAAKVDANQHAIVKALRANGASVQHLHTVGRGCPDLLVGYKGHNVLMELKTDGGNLTDDEIGWHDNWRGNVWVVRSVNQALDILDEYGNQDTVPNRRAYQGL